MLSTKPISLKEIIYFLYWLIDFLTDWLTDWMTDWLQQLDLKWKDCKWLFQAYLGITGVGLFITFLLKMGSFGAKKWWAISIDAIIINFFVEIFFRKEKGKYTVTLFKIIEVL